ncbi:hypothetical protein XvhCFBP2543_01410 [Xanthomonas vasicola]|uniref:Uncharacterized protein n=1 Tax=Xanthomonas vasicola TaxID=56459 RepID=A0ABD7S9H0_XANVA|nr:hypothetical protein NX81_022125 [Xanthomonas vasicola]PPV04555.1 hypothetical protein XvhCFBP2543_01410 [Xanthomonas vasicola]TWQ29912.1 hypothetical protein FQJ97_22060 [Xanthomonas vasicola]TWQ35560.1 hypothetical protein FQJ96_17305 [Xanthomonas vasicola]TWQ52267.1 hypothetical protein FQK01_13225 [Xanthomonas vasicola]
MTGRNDRRAEFQQSSKLSGVVSCFPRTASQLSAEVSLPIAGPLAAWMPPSSPHGWVYGVSRER